MRPSRPAKNQIQNPPACDWTRNRLLIYLDGELPTGERARLQAHLDACTLCRSELTAYRSSERALSSVLREIPAAGDLRPGFYAKLAEAQAAERARPRWQSRLVFAAPVFAAAVLGIVFLRPVLAPPAPRSNGSQFAKSEPLLPGQKVVTPVEVAQNPLPAAKPNVLMAENSDFAAMAAPVKKSLSGERFAGSRRPLLRNAVPNGKMRSPFMVANADVAADSFGERKESPLSFRRKVRENYREAGASYFAMKSAADLLTAKPESLNGLADRSNLYSLSTNGPGAKDQTASLPDEGVDLQVQDDERGFTASTKLASATTETEDGPVVTIEAEGEGPDTESGAF